MRACFGAINAHEAVGRVIGPLSAAVDRVVVQEDQAQGKFS